MNNISTYDIIEAFYIKNEKDIKFTIEDINGIILQLKEGAKYFISSLEEELNMFAEVKGVCPHCGEQIVTISESDEDRGEYFGTPVVEKETTYGCPECGYTIESI